MGWLKSFVIFALLLNLGLTLGADLMAKDDHHSAPTQERVTELCYDACHAGGCHLGHCSIVFKASPASEFPSPAEQIRRAAIQSRVDEPFLEGLRRPPKA